MRSLLFIIYVFGVVILTAQRKKMDTSALLLQPDRVEFEFLRYDDNFYVVPGKSDGLLVVQKTFSKNYQGNNWKITKLDTAFQTKWESFAGLNVRKELIGYDYYRNYYYLLFADAYKQEELTVFRLSAETGDVYQVELSTVFPMAFSHFEVIDETLLLAGQTNFRPVIITYNLNEGKPRVLPGIYDGKSYLLDVVVDDHAGIFSAMMLERVHQRRFTVRVKSYTKDGLMIQDNRLNPDDAHNLIDGATTIFNNGHQYFAGTHSRKSTKYSSGLYLSKFVNGDQKFIKYYNYADLNNFFGYLNSKRETRIKQRINKRKTRGRQNRYNYQLTVHEIIERDDHYILVAEAYYARYASNAYSTHGYINPSSPGGYNSNFLGYTYTHAIVVGFDRNGNILWDHSFKIGDISVFNLIENVKVSLVNDQVVLMYLEDNEIRSKVIQDDKIVEGKTMNPVRLLYETDELRSKYSSIEVLDEWYDETFMAYGEQNVGTVGRGFNNTRNIFYINKIRYSKISPAN